MFFGLACIVTGCSTGPEPVPEPPADVEPTAADASEPPAEDAQAPVTDVHPDPEDTAAADTADVQDAPDLPAADPCAEAPYGPACPCNEPGPPWSDCESGLCVDTGFGAYCSPAPLCLDVCPGDWTCQPFQLDDVDVYFECAYAYPSLCAPCRQDSDCDSGLIVGGAPSRCTADTSGVGSYCGAPCDLGGSCLPGFECE